MWESFNVKLAELFAVSLTFILNLLVTWARHLLTRRRGTNYCSNEMDGCYFKLVAPGVTGY